ncbi:MAG: M36 family metallopeptidase [Chloracidobacterium sp.]|nr:M36 family metallopeptidase [Chloracidobacterium sp.]
MASLFMFESRRRALFCLCVLGVFTAVFALPFQMRSNAAKGFAQRTESHEADLPNYDIRVDKSKINKIAEFRNVSGKSASEVADAREAFVRGEEALKQRVPTLKIEYNEDIRIPEVIAPDVKQGRAFLTGPTTPARTSHANVLINFLKQNTELVGTNANQIDGLKVFSDYTNPDGNLSFVELNQEINGVPVFRGEVKAGFTRRGEMIRVINNLAPSLDYNSLSTDFNDPLAAVRAAAALINNDTSKLNLRVNSKESTDIKTVFGTGDSAPTAEKMYFPTEPGVAIPAWRVLIWQPVNAYYVIVDAATGTMLWRKNITQDQTQSATYSVYANPNAMINVADNPFPLTPGPTSPNGSQGAAIGRTSITRIGNEAPYTFNNLGWITDGLNKTDGNAIQAGLDRDGTDGVDTNSEAAGTSRTFNFSYNPLNPNTNTGDAPIPATQTYPGSAFQQGTVTQLFYISNWYHDELYRLGFTEQARNFQNDNFGRGGVGNDRVRGEGQDSSGTNNANFSTPADGGRGRMQMYIWTGSNPDIDGNVDADVVIHELTHGTSNRLHGNGSGLSTNMSSGMGEGWGDFYGHSLLSEPGDPINGVYTTGGYDTYLGQSGTYTNNYYYGIRRFPKAVIAFTGGPNNRPHNPLTFADADSTQISLTDGAYTRGPYGSSTADQVHALGEIWSSALWEVRAKFVTRLGWADGNRKVLQLVTDGMKLAPIGPTFLSERDAILAAAQASSFAPEAAIDVADVWGGFALRGIGASASIQVNGSSGTTRVTEAFDLPNLYQTPNLTISDASGDNDGFPEPGELLSLAIPLTNSTGSNAASVTLQIVGGGSANYGTIVTGATVSQQVSYSVPPGTVCGSTITLTLNVNSSLGATSFTRTFSVGQPTVTLTENFDGVTAPAFPAGWAAAVVQSGINFVTSNTTPDTAPNVAFALDPTTVGGGTDLTSPSIAINSAAATVTFRNNYDTEPGWDGGVLEISIGAGAFQDVITAGGAFVQNGYNGSLGAGANNPIASRSAWTGNSAGYITSIVRLPAAASGQNVRLKWRFGADDNTTGSGASPGWRIDSIQVAGSYTCNVSGPTPTATNTPVFTPTSTNTATATNTPTFTPTATNTATFTPTATNTATFTPTASNTATFTPTSTNTPTFTPTATNTPTPPPVISGTVTYGNAIPAATRFVSDVLLSGVGSPNVSATTGSNGTYSLSGFGAGSYTITPSKTGAANGSISSFDAARISQHTTGGAPLTGNQLVVADVSGNGVVSSFDSAQLARYIVSSPPFGTTGNWIFNPASSTHVSVNSNISDENYSALLMGEVSGNWVNVARSENEVVRMDRIAVSAPTLVTPDDKEVLIPVNISGITNKGIIAYEFDLRYDPSVIQPQTNAVDVAGTNSRGLTAVVNAEEAGLLRVAAYGPMPIESDGVLLNLRFTALGVNGSVSPLTWERIMFNEGDSTTITANGKVELSDSVPELAEISGRVLTAFGIGVPNAQVKLTDTTGRTLSAVSNGFGYYRFGDLKIGETFTLSIDSRGRSFTPVMVSTNGQLLNLDMIAVEKRR